MVLPSPTLRCCNSSAEDPRTTGSLVFILPHPWVNKTKQYSHVHDHERKEDRQSVIKMGEERTGGVSDIEIAKYSGEDPRATGCLVSNIPQPCVNKTKQHTPSKT